MPFTHDPMQMNQQTQIAYLSKSVRASTGSTTFASPVASMFSFPFLPWKELKIRHLRYYQAWFFIWHFLTCQKGLALQSVQVYFLRWYSFHYYSWGWFFPYYQEPPCQHPGVTHSASSSFIAHFGAPFALFPSANAKPGARLEHS